MPSAKRRGTPVQRAIAWSIIAALAAGYLYYLYEHPIIVVGFSAAMFALDQWNRRKTTRHLTELARARSGESICEFARAFDTRRVDTWVIRAVYEQVQQQLRWVYPGFPVRATDRLKEDLWMDPDDIDMDITDDVTSRTGRSMRDHKQNPMYGKVTTVADLVAFFAAQPKS
jgi:hypothetical protein